MMGVKEQIIQFIKDEVKDNNKNSFFREPLVGFSSANDELYKNIKEIVGKHHLFPEEILPEVKSVVSFFIPFSEELIESNRGREVSEEWAKSYVEGNSLINSTCEKLAEKLKEDGIKSGIVKATFGYDKELLMAVWSHRSAAFIAGLGRFGVNRMLITEKGGAGRYGSLLISEPIEPDKRPDKDHCYTLSGGKCSYCTDICPVNAIKPDGFERRKCQERLAVVGRNFRHIGTCDVCGKCVVGPCAIFEGDQK